MKIRGLCECGCGNYTRIAKTNNPRWGRVKGKPSRFLHNHHTRMESFRKVANACRSDEEVLKTIERKTMLIPFSGCIVWMGAFVPPWGYGVMGYRGKQKYVHRIVWQIAGGEIPKGKFVLHKCDTPPCVRLDHLFLGTPSDNMQDMTRKGRCRSGGPSGDRHGSRTHPERVPRGECNGQSKLTQEEADEIRRIYHTGSYTQKQVSEIFGVSQLIVSRLVRGITYAPF